MMEPIAQKAGDKRVLINGHPPKADFRIVAEDEWRRINSENERLRRTEESLRECKHYYRDEAIRAREEREVIREQSDTRKDLLLLLEGSSHLSDEGKRLVRRLFREEFC